MATVLDQPETVREEITFSFPILKWENDADGDLVVKGIATDGTVDSDSQIVDATWSADALTKWLSTGGNVRMSHDPHRPVGKGLRVDVNKDGSGKHWVTSVVVDPLAQKLVKKGVLTAYSVGISRPVIKHDPSGRARGGIITGGELAELSLVDRPSNKSSYLELAKSAANGDCEFTGKMVGADELEKMLTATDKVSPSTEKADISSWNSDEALFSFTPADMAKLVKNKIIDQHYSDLALEALYAVENEVYKRDVSVAERRSLASSGNALPDGSYPIKNTGDLDNAAHLARTGHGNAEAAKKLVARRAQELGVANPLADSEEKIVKDTAEAAVPEIVKDPATMAPQSVGEEGDAACASPGKKLNSQSLDADGDTDGDGDAQAGIPKAAKPKVKKPKAGKKLPPWLNKPGSDNDADDSSKFCKLDHVHSEKCHTPPDVAAGVPGHDMDPAPVGELQESPAPSHMKAQAVSLRYKTIGIDSDMGALHDFTCPAYSPEDVASYHPLADFSTLVNENVWQRKALAAAAGRSIEEAMEAQKAWQAAAILKAADPVELNAYRRELHKAFRDANPGPTSYPSPGSISPQRFCRPNIGGGSGHSRDSSGYGPPNSHAPVASSAPNAQSFNRPPLSGTHQSPSPSFMKTTQPYPDQPGVPVRLSYPEIEREKARRSLSMMHDHLTHMFPSVCPMLDHDAYAVETNPTTTIGPIAGLGKAIEPEQQAEVLSDVYKYIKKLEKKVRAGEITEAEARDRLSKRTAEKYARNLAKDVQKGMTSMDEIAKALGIEKTAAAPVPLPEPEKLDKGMTPDVMKTMFSEILEPFQAQITAQHQMMETQTAKIAEYQQLLQAQQEKINIYDQRFEALANTADPSTNAFTGLALRKAAPAGAVRKQAEVSEQVQGMMMRQLERTWRTSDNPAEREAAYSALNKMKSTFE